LDNLRLVPYVVDYQKLRKWVLGKILYEIKISNQAKQTAACESLCALISHIPSEDDRALQIKKWHEQLALASSSVLRRAYVNLTKAATKFFSR
jgi:hypothetical protein